MLCWFLLSKTIESTFNSMKRLLKSVESLMKTMTKSIESAVKSILYQILLNLRIVWLWYIESVSITVIQSTQSHL